MKTPIETLAVTTAETLPAVVRPIPAALVPIPKDGVIMPSAPFDIRTNMQGAQPSIRLGAGITETNAISLPLLIHVCGFRTIRQIKLSEQYEHPCDVSQLLGIARIKDRKVFACITFSSSSSSSAEKAMQYLELEGGMFANIVKIGIRKETAKKGGFKFGIAEFSFAPANEKELGEMLDFYDNVSDPHLRFLPLRNIVTNTETGEIETQIIP